MKRTITTAALALSALAAAAQDYGESSAVRIDEAGRIHRTEVIPYDTRRDAEARNREAGGYYLAFSPRQMAAAGDMAVSGATLDIPYAWTDGVIYLHLENVGSAYSLWINDRPVAEVEDPATPAEFAVSPYIRQGANDIRLVLRPSATPQINPATPRREAFANSYLYYQNKRSIRDFEIALVPDSTRRFGVLELAIVAQNAFNYDEKVTVGYDIYSPQGKLLDFNMREVSIPGRSVDTVRFSPFIYGSYDNEWKAGGKTPPLYKVMLFTRRDGVYKEYMPLRIGFGRTELEEGRPMRTTLAELKALKAPGKNTVCPDFPQPAWFYELCDRTGLYVIDRAAIDAPERRDDRRVGGTPSNDPALADEYLERVRAMYYRSRNFTCVVAYDLGSPSGNGYNMYKAYEWLRSVEPSRPVIYGDADGEWNTDL